MKKFQILIECDEVPENMFQGEVEVKGKVIASSLGNGLLEDIEKAEKYEDLLIESGFTHAEIIKRLLNK